MAVLLPQTESSFVRHTESSRASKAYGLPRLLCGMASRAYGETIGWLPNVALYLFQLDAVAGRRHAAVDVP